MKNRKSTPGIYSFSLSSVVGRRVLATAALAFTLSLTAYFAADGAAASHDSSAMSDPKFSCTITGSSKDGYDIHVEYDGEEAKKCKATCSITKADGGRMEKTHEATVRKTSKAWFFGEAGLSGAPFSDATISSSGCSS